MTAPKLLVSRIILLIILVAVALMSLWVLRAYQEFLALRREEVALRQKFKAAEAENQRLRDEIRIAATPEAIERDAKARLNLKKPGEEVVVVIPASVQATTSGNAKLSIFARLGSWFRLLFR